VAASDPIKRRAIELALDEALANAMIHGNLEVPSHLKETDFESFNEMIANRRAMEPYASRKLDLSTTLGESQAVFTITDQGRGFDWRGIMEREADTEAAHGRGLLIIKTLATSISFNDKGNEITLTFDLGKKEPALAVN
jgi:anti-sigma regulatory factor (Ser/Thr protein kinase)